MTTINDGGPAFPFGQISETTGQPVNGFYDPGMSLRDYFAAKAMQGLLAHDTRYRPRARDSHMHWHGAMAKEAYELADAMLEQRRKR